MREGTRNRNTTWDGLKGKRFDSISGRVHRNRIDAQHTKGKTVKTGMQHAGRQVRLL